MSLTDEERQVMVEVEIERAEKILSQVETLRANALWDILANRLYYALYHAVISLLIKNRIQVGTHKGAVVMFSREFVKTGIFSTEEGRVFSSLEQLRESGDYNCLIETTETEIVPYIPKVTEINKKIKTLLKIIHFIITTTKKKKKKTSLHLRKRKG